MADSVVVADNVELVANNIQSKVGATLLGTKAMAENTTGGSESSFKILEQVKDLQQATVDKVHAVWEILKSQLDIEKDEARRIREQAKENALESKSGGGGGVSGLESAAGSLGSSMMDKMKGFGAGLFTMAGLMSVAGKIFKAGLILMLAGFLGDALVDHFDINDDATKSALQKGLPAAAVLVALFGFKNALLVIIPAIIGMGFASVISWIKGDKVAGEVSGFDWGSVALAGPALLLLAKLGTGMKFATLAALVGGWPIVLGVSLALALAAGIGYLFSKVQQAEQKMLDHLGEMTDISQQELEDRLKKQKSGFIASSAPGVAKLFGMETTHMDDVYMASKAAAATVKSKDGKLEVSEVTNIVKQVDMLAQMDPTTLKEMLDDKDKADVLMRSINKLLVVAGSGQLGDSSAAVIKQLQGLAQNVQMTAKDMYAEKEKSGDTGWLDGAGYLQDIADDKTAGFKGGDMFERYAELLQNPEYMKAKTEKESIEGESRYQELKAIPKKDRTNDENAEWKDYYNRLRPLDAKMNRLGRGSDGQQITGEVRMSDVFKLLTKDEQAQLIESALSDKKVLLKAMKLTQTKENEGGSNIIDNKKQSVITTTNNKSNFSTTSSFEVDYALRQAVASQR
jgi:hypothetical protein|tara:strand:- start:4334 stop:6214 length:1881 start_codon:yes stop_codon:yes gene_type:complete